MSERITPVPAQVVLAIQTKHIATGEKATARFIVYGPDNTLTENRLALTHDMKNEESPPVLLSLPAGVETDEAVQTYLREQGYEVLSGAGESCQLRYQWIVRVR